MFFHLHLQQGPWLLEITRKQGKQGNKENYILFSTHREENVDSTKKFKEIIKTIKALKDKFNKKIVMGVHPRIKKKIEAENFDMNFIMCPPFAYSDYLKLQSNAFCVVSDSGTITEESSIMGFPAVNFREQNLQLDVCLHIGSFLAVVTYFYRDLVNFVKNKDLFLKIFISSIPVMIVGYFLVKLELIHVLRNIKIIGWTTIIFGVLLFISDKSKVNQNLDKNFSLKSAIFIGVFQILSLIPGVSRSGISITAARMLNFNRFDSAKISFLLSIPTLAAVSFFGIRNLFITDNFYFTKISILSIFLSFIFSYVTIKFFLKYIQKFSLDVFVVYRILLGIILLTYAYL